MDTRSWRTTLVILICGSIVVLLATGLRISFGLFLKPMSSQFGWGREIFALAMAIQNLLWGVFQPFVGAVAMLMLFGRNGSINLLLDQWFGVTIPFMEGLNGVIFVESVHYFPFILINLSAVMQNIDRSMEESAQNLGCSGMRLFRRIVLPLAWPGYVAGASLVFLKVFDDLGTPLLLNVNNMLACSLRTRSSGNGSAVKDAPSSKT